MIRSAVFIILAMLASSGTSAREFVRDDIIANPSHQRFSVCFNHSCKAVNELSISPSDWVLLTADMIPIASDAAQERQRIKHYIARMEQFIGPLTGTDKDLPGMFRGAFKRGQMDCIDEATNTTSYLRLLEHARLLHWHSVGSPSTRFVLPVSWPHTAALITESQTGDLFIVDSWFEENGKPPHIVPLDSWKKGWKPSQEAQDE